MRGVLICCSLVLLSSAAYGKRTVRASPGAIFDRKLQELSFRPERQSGRRLRRSQEEVKNKCGCTSKMAAPITDEQKRCSPGHVGRQCRQAFGLQSSQLKLEDYVQETNCSLVGKPGSLQTNLFTLEERMLVTLSWSKAKGSSLSKVTGYLIEMFDRKYSGYGKTPCALMVVPPCQNTWSFSKWYSKTDSNWDYFVQCLDLMKTFRSQEYKFQVTTLPLPPDGDRTAMMTSNEIKEMACTDSKEDQTLLGPLCQAKLKMLPPKWDKSDVSYTLANHTISITWKRPASNFPIKNYQLRIENQVFKGSGQNNSLVRQLLPANVTSYVARVPRVGCKYKVYLTVKDEMDIQHLLQSDPDFKKLPEIIANEYDLSQNEIGGKLYEIYENDLLDGRDTTSFIVTFQNDGQWKPWSSWVGCLCGRNSAERRHRECTPPGAGGIWCVGDVLEERACPFIDCPVGQISKKTSSKLSGNPSSKSSGWYRQPVFYVTLSTAVLVLLLTALIVTKVWQRRKRASLQRQVLLPPAPVDSTVWPEQNVLINDPGRVIFLENDFTPPDVNLVLSSPEPFSFFTRATHVSHKDDCADVAELLAEEDAVQQQSAMKQSTVYISYARFSDIHDRNVLTFSEWLMRLGINVILDKWDTIGLGANIAGWTERNMMLADKIIVVVSSEYFADWYSMESRLGDESRCTDRQACLEAKLIQTRIMEGRCANRVCLPVFLGPVYERSLIPAMLENSVWFRLLEDDVAVARKFLYYLSGVEEHQRPEIGGEARERITTPSELF